MTDHQFTQRDLFEQAPKRRGGKPQRYSDAAEAALVLAYVGGESSSSLAERHGCTNSFIYAILRRHGVTQRNRRIVDDAAREKIAALYEQGLTHQEIADRTGWSKGPILDVIGSGLVRPRGIARRFHVDHGFFSGPPSESRDYALGFIAADGCVQSDLMSLCFNQQARDRCHLENLRDAMGCANPVNGGVNYNSNTGRTHPKVSLQIHSVQMCTDLGRFGITPRKSLTLQITGVESSPHFWRGVLDGDGTVGLYQRRRSLYPSMALSSASEAFIRQFAAFVETHLGVGGENVNVQRYKNPKHNPHYKFGLRGYRASALCRLLYDGCAIALPRKQAVALEVIRWADPEAIAARKANRRGRPRRSNGTFLGA